MKAIKYFLTASVAMAIAGAVVSAHAQAPVSAPAPTVMVTAEQKAAVKELLDAMNFKQMMSQMTGAMTQNMPKMMDQFFMSNSKLSDAEKAEARRLGAKSTDSAMQAMSEIYSDPEVIQGMESIMARMYTKNFSVDEVKAITAFYVSPAGKKTLTILPQMMQQTMPEMMGLLAPRMNATMTKMMDDIAEEAKKNSKAKAPPAKK